MKNSNNTSLFQREQVRESLKQSLIKLHPGMMMRNPIMFTVEIATMIMLLVTVYSLFSDGQGDFLYNFLVFVILFLTLLFANFAEAIAEARGKAQADSLRRTREETPAKLIVDGTVTVINSSQLKKGIISNVSLEISFPPTGRLSKVWLPLTKALLRGNPLRLSVSPAGIRVP